jgi:hypothetical protein
MIPIRATVCPGAFAFILAVHCRAPHILPALLPALWHVQASQPTRSVDALIALLPRSAYAAFKVGRLVEKLQNPSVSDVDVLREAREHFQREVNGHELREVERALFEADSQVSLMTRLRGAVSFVNVMWFVSIVGLAVTLWPALSVVGGELLRKLSAWFVARVLPALRYLHSIGVFEILAYAACLVIVSQAARYPKESGSPGSFVALTAAAFSFLAFHYTLTLFVTNDEDKNLGLFFNGFAAAVLTPLAIVHDSTLVGFFGVWALLGCLGFSVVSSGLCYSVGFESEDALARVAASSAVLVVAFVSARLLQCSRLIPLRPFGPGVMILGTCTYFLAFLIESSGMMRTVGSGMYVRMQVWTVVSLILAQGVGRVCGLQSLSNCSATFGALYIVEKLAELPWGAWDIVGMFLGFALLYAAATFLRSHPTFLLRMLDPDGFIV